MNTHYFAYKGQRPCIISVGQRPTNEVRICSLRPERATAKLQTWIPPFQGLGSVAYYPSVGRCPTLMLKRLSAF
jgi:hypothetical protein